MSKKRFRNGGFTLIELLIVMVILGLLASLVAPRLVGKVGKSKTRAAQAQVELLSTALESYRLDVGRYPATKEGLSALVKAPEDVKGWDGPYLRKETIPNDPWNRPYRYRCPGEHMDYDIFSYGADDKQGGEGEDSDIVSWK